MHSFWLYNIAGNPNMVVAFAGNKADLEDKRKVTAEVSITVFSVFQFFCNSGEAQLFSVKFSKITDYYI